MKTGIFGGTFNPIHTGHLILAEQAYSELALDRVFFIPSGRSYFKDGIKMPDASVRLHMCELACKGNDHFGVLDLEVKRPGNSYTCETLEEIKSLYPEDELYYICGMDSFAQLSLFRDPEKIFSLSRIVAATRIDAGENDGYEKIRTKYEKEYGAKIERLDASRIDISSSMIREYLARERSVRYYLPESVFSFIMENDIYG